MEEQIKALQDAFEAKLKEAASKEQMETLKSELMENIGKLELGVQEDRIKELETAFDDKLKAQWEEVTVKLESVETTTPSSFREVIKNALVNAGVTETEEIDGEQVTRIKWDRNKSYEVSFYVKSAVDMNTANAVRPGATPGMNIGYLTNYGMMPQELPLSQNIHFMDVFGGQTLGVRDKYFGVVIESTETDGSGLKAETAVAGDSSYLWETKEYKVFDFASKFRVHQNTLDDIENVISRIETIGMDRLKSKIDTFSLGSAGDNSATPYGMLNAGYFTAYDTALRAGEVKSANIVNVIKNAVLQASNADEMVDTVILNANDIAEIEDLKDAQDNTIRLAGVVVDATGKLSYIYGLRVIKNNKMTANTAIVCNGESLQFGIRKGFAVRMGYDQTTDFSKNIVTIQLEGRMAIGLGKAASIIYISDIVSASGFLNAPTA